MTYSFMAFFTWYNDLASVTFSGAKFQILIASLVLVFLVVLDFPISIGLPFNEALVATPERGTDYRSILSG